MMLFGWLSTKLVLLGFFFVVVVAFCFEMGFHGLKLLIFLFLLPKCDYIHMQDPPSWLKFSKLNLATWC